ncbi:MAG: putative dsRNA-binding protein, partial [Waddliaceae bacterium]
RGRDSILSDLFEAIIGAIYLDDGLEAARNFLFGNFAKIISDIVKTPIRNWKAILQDYCQRKFQKPPLYKVMSESGPDHQKSFSISVIINEEELGVGHGTSKKIAQQQAAEDALSKLPWQKQ